MVEVVARLWSPTGALGILIKLAALARVFIAVVAGTRAVQPAELRALRRRPSTTTPPAAP